MGGRLLRSWVEKPLVNKEKIEARLSAVEALYKQHVLSENLRDQLSQVYDMERLLSKVSYHTLNARDCLSLLRSLEKAPEVLNLLSGVEDDALSFLKELLDPLPELADLLRSCREVWCEIVGVGNALFDEISRLQKELSTLRKQA